MTEAPDLGAVAEDLERSQNTVEFWMYWAGAAAMPFGWGSRFDLVINPGWFGFNTGNGDFRGVPTDGFGNRWVYVVAVFTNGEPAANLL